MAAPTGAYRIPDEPKAERAARKVVDLVLEETWAAIGRITESARASYTEPAKARCEDWRKRVAGEDIAVEGVSRTCPVSVVDTDLYVGRSDGRLERMGVLYAETTLLSNEILANPVSAISASHVTVPVVAVSDGTRLAVVSFPLAAVATKAEKRPSLPQAAAPPPPPDADGPRAEKDRMQVVLDDTPARHAPADPAEPSSGGGYTVAALLFSPCGTVLAVTLTHTSRPPVVAVYNIGEVEYEYKPGAAAVEGSAVCFEGGSARETPSLSFLPDDSGAPAHGLCIAWLNGHTVDVHALRRFPQVEAALAACCAADGGAPSKAAAAAAAPPPPPAKGARKPSSRPPPGDRPSSARPSAWLFAAPPPNRPHRQLTFPVAVTAVATNATGELLAVGCLEGLLRVYNLVTSALVLSTSVAPEMSESSRRGGLPCLAIAVWEDRYVASSWAVASGQSTLTVHDATAEGRRAEKPRVGDHGEGFADGSWLPATVKRVGDAGPPRPAKKRASLQHAGSERPFSQTGNSEGDPTFTCTGHQTQKPREPGKSHVTVQFADGREATGVDFRPTELVATVKRVPTVRRLLFADIAPFLFFAPASSRLSVFDCLSKTVVAVFPMGPGLSILGCPSHDGLPIPHDTQADLPYPVLALASAITTCASAPKDPAEPRQARRSGGSVPLVDRVLPAGQRRLAEAALASCPEGICVISAAAPEPGRAGVGLSVTCLNASRVVSFAYPTLARALTGYAGADTVLELLRTSHYSDLLNEEYVQSKLAPLPPSMLSKGQKKDGQSMAGRSMRSMAAHKVGFESNMEGSLALSLDRQPVVNKNLVGAAAHCMAFVENKRLGKNSRKARVMAMLSDLQNW
ncbi:hypothetical protein DIPPA_30238 [Diplonema papillatum]|nr:hypothetical protein DIPPA_30238 [Diplonema papillatum]